eukprot:1160295-Pelagomonas_calceolata.AAC.7
MDSIHHIALRSPDPTMNGSHTNRHHVLASVFKPSAKADMAHPSLVWMHAKMRDPWSRAQKSLKTSPKLSLIGFALMVMVSLPGTKAARMLGFRGARRVVVESERRRVRAFRSMADNLQIYICSASGFLLG